MAKERDIKYQFVRISPVHPMVHATALQVGGTTPVDAAVTLCGIDLYSTALLGRLGTGSHRCSRCSGILKRCGLGWNNVGEV